MKWTKKEKEILLGFAIASDEENVKDMFEYISCMMKENGYNRNISQVKNMYYKILKK